MNKTDRGFAKASGRGWLVFQGEVLYVVGMYYWMVLGGWRMACANGGCFDTGSETPILVTAVSSQWQSFARIITLNSMRERAAT